MDTGGNNYVLSNQMRNAYLLFFSDYVHRYGGVLINGSRHAIELVLLDDGGEKLVARWGGYILQDEENLEFYLGPYSSTLTHQLAYRAHSAGGVMIAPGASATSIYSNRPGLFGLLPPSSYYAQSVLELLASQENGIRKSIYVVSESSQDHHSTLAAQLNFTVLNNTQVSAAGTTVMQAVSDLLADVMRQAPDVLLASVKGDICHELVRQAYSLRYSPKAFVLMACPSGEEFISQVGNAGQYILHVTPWLPSMMLAGNVTGTWTSQSFADEFQTRYGSTPPYQVASAFTAAALLVHGMEKANSMSPTDVMNAIRDIRAESIFGDFSFDSNGQSTMRMKVTQYQMRASPALIYPCSSCSGTLVYPRPDRANIECQDTRELDTPYGFMNGTCVQCPEGTESVVANATGTLQRICRFCAEGTFGLRDGAKQRCVPCPLGFYSDVQGLPECRACPLGRASNVSGAVACDVCQAGSVAELPGQRQCAICAKGTYQNETGMSSCTRCQVGSYVDVVGATECKLCLPTFKTEGTGYTSIDDCGCPQGTYNSQLSSAYDDQAAGATCVPCPLGVTCDGFSAPLQLKLGYHAQAANFDPVSDVWKCTPPDACPGGPPGRCSSLLVGVACGECPKSYARVSGGSMCALCAGGNRFLPVFMLVMVIPVLTLFYYLAAMSATIKETTVKLGFNIVCSVTITLFQILGMMYNLNIEWPERVRRIFQISAALLADTEVFRLECVTGEEPQTSYISMAIAPFAAIFVFIILFGASRILPLVSRRRLEAWDVYTACTALGGLGQMTFIALAGIAAKSLQCYQHPNGKASMVSYPSVICWAQDGDHNAILGMGAVLMVGIVVPFLGICFWGCYSVYIASVSKGVAAEQLTMYRFLIWRFRPMVWWWSCVFNIRQLILGFAPMIKPSDPNVQLSVVVIVLMAYLITVVGYFPWRSFEINMLDSAVTALLIMTVIGVTPFLPRSSDEETHLVILTAFVSILLVCICCMVIYIVTNLCLRGVKGHFGAHFPPPEYLESFTAEWSRIAKRVTDMSPEEHLKLMKKMDDFDRREVDKVMSILSASYDIVRTVSWVRHRSTLEWVPQVKVLRIGATTDDLTRSASSKPEGPSEASSGEAGPVACERRDTLASQTSNGATSPRVPQERPQERQTENHCIRV